MPDPEKTTPLVVDKPVAGHYLIRLARDAPLVPCEIGKYSEKFSALAASICGEPADLFYVWEHACGRPIDKADYDYRMACFEYDQKFDPGSPLANPRRSIDLEKMKPAW